VVRVASIQVVSESCCLADKCEGDNLTWVTAIPERRSTSFASAASSFSSHSREAQNVDRKELLVATMLVCWSDRLTIEETEAQLLAFCPLLLSAQMCGKTESYWQATSTLWGATMKGAL